MLIVCSMPLGYDILWNIAAKIHSFRNTLHYVADATAGLIRHAALQNIKPRVASERYISEKYFLCDCVYDGVSLLILQSENIAGLNPANVFVLLLRTYSQHTRHMYVYEVNNVSVHISVLRLLYVQCTFGIH